MEDGRTRWHKRANLTWEITGVKIQRRSFCFQIDNACIDPDKTTNRLAYQIRISHKQFQAVNILIEFA